MRVLEIVVEDAVLRLRRHMIWSIELNRRKLSAATFDHVGDRFVEELGAHLLTHYPDVSEGKQGQGAMSNSSLVEGLHYEWREPPRTCVVQPMPWRR